VPIKISIQVSNWCGFRAEP